MYEMISNMTDRPVHLIYGDTKVKVREEVRAISEETSNNIILGSYGTMSTGVNIKNLHHVIFASPSKSRIRVLQSIGRGLRKARGKNSACSMTSRTTSAQTEAGTTSHSTTLLNV